MLYFAILFSGCAVHYKNQQGEDRYFGFMMMGVTQNSCASIISSQTLGLNIDFTSASGGANIGYRSLTSVSFSDGVVTASEGADFLSGQFKGGDNYYCFKDSPRVKG